MADEQEVVQEPAQTEEVSQEAPQTEEVQAEAPVTTEQPEEGTAEVKEEATAPEEAQPEVPKHKIKWQGQEVEVDESELVELAQKGFDYTKKMQSYSELEKANQQKLQLADQFLSNPNAVKYAVAQQLGYDPNMVMGNLKPPDPNIREIYPEQYGREEAYYQLASQQKAQFENALNGMMALNTQSVNNAVLQKARLEHELNDEQFNTVQQFLTGRVRPNQAGFYTTEDVDYVVRALYGEQKKASALLNQTTKIQKIIKESKPRSPVPQRAVEDVPSDVKSARDYKKWTQDMQGGWTKKG